MDIELKLKGLLSNHENEIVEFKEAKNTYDFNKLGKYFSALSNEANLFKKDAAWLVFGVSDKKQIVGSSFRTNPLDLQSLQREIAAKTSENLTFIDIHVLQLPEGRVLMFQIPPAPKGLPIAWEGHYYGRNGEELSHLNIEEMERIRKQATNEDWSAGIVEDATIEDLELEAIEKARKNFRAKNPHLAQDIDKWDTLTFLNKAKMAIKGKLTRTAILLLGKSEAEHFIQPADAKIRWILKDAQNKEKDWVIFNIPFLLAVDNLYSIIRNLQYRYLPEGTLFPEEVLRYEPYTIREALNNCIAHQDYTLGGRINVVEKEEDELVFTNVGSFLPEDVEKVVFEDAPQEQYRNRFLVEAMVNLKMVDSIGSGIRKMFEYQKERFFPMPEYTLSKERVELRITGKVLDMEFAKILAHNPKLGLKEILLLDSVQKKKTLNETQIKHLKKLGLIEGKKPNFYLSSKTVKPLTDELKAQYIKQKGFDDEHYKKMILEYLGKFGSANRQSIDKLLLDKLPDIMDNQQKKNKVTNLLSALRRENKIRNEGNDFKSNWVLV